jgi:hypothetical protein
MLNLLKVQLTFPTGAYAPATTVNALKRGDSMSSAQYVIDPADVLTATSSNVAQALASYNLNRRSPGQAGTNRGQVLTQFVVLDAKGTPRIISASTVVAMPNDFQPLAGTTVNLDNLVNAAVASNVGLILNPDADTTTPRAQGSVAQCIRLGILP